MKNRLRFAALMAALFAFSSFSVVAQNERTLELDTDDGPIDVPLDDNVPLRILGNGDISATAAEGFSCPTGGPSCEDVQVSLLTADGGSFSASPNPVSQGSVIAFSWDSLGAWFCSGTGLPGTTWDSNNPKSPSGQQSVDTSALTAGNTYNVELICANGPVTASRSLAIEVQEDDGGQDPEGCEGVGELSDFSEWQESSDFGTPPSWVATFGNDFPKGVTADVILGKGEYVALRFTTPGSLNSNSSGRVNSETTPSYNPGERMMSITPCPGQFDPQEMDDPNCLLANLGSTGEFKWYGPGHSLGQYFCELQPDTTYYLNMLFSGSPAGTMPPVPECVNSSSTTCGVKLQPRDNNQ